MQLNVWHRPPTVIFQLRQIAKQGSNFHVDDPKDTSALKFLEIVDTCGLSQHIHEPTHQSGHTLDLLITRSSESILFGNPVVDFRISDHDTILSRLRKLKGINIADFKKDISESVLCNATPQDLNTVVSLYNSTLSDILDKHAPLQSRSMVERPHNPWFNDTIKEEKKKRRKCERDMKSNLSSEEASKQFKHQKNYVNWLMDKSRRECYSSQIEKCGSDQRALFNVVKSLCGEKVETPFPEHNSVHQLSEDFSEYFITKIKDIRSKLDAETPDNIDMAMDPVNVDIDPLTDFKRISDEDIRSIIMNCATTTCDLDPLTTSVLKECIDSLLPVISHIVNTSLQTGQFPDSWKLAIIIPLIKKLGLDLILKSYRPVSNLQFISKVTEKASALQICDHMDTKKLHYRMQSSYRPGHSTETALLKVQNDVYCAMDKEEVVLLLLLDLSAAFDTVDHSILLHRLENRF